MNKQAVFRKLVNWCTTRYVLGKKRFEIARVKHLIRLLILAGKRIHAKAMTMLPQASENF